MLMPGDIADGGALSTVLDETVELTVLTVFVSAYVFLLNPINKT